MYNICKVLDVHVSECVLDKNACLFQALTGVPNKVFHVEDASHFGISLSCISSPSSEMLSKKEMVVR